MGIGWKPVYFIKTSCCKTEKNSYLCKLKYIAGLAFGAILLAYM